VINQACFIEKGKLGELDSCALSAYADGIRLLAGYSKVKILSDIGRRVIAKIK